MNTPVKRLAVFAAALLPALTQAEDLPKEKLEFFEKQIRPILSDKCYKCHSVEAGKSKGGLKLDTRDALLKGGESGPGLIPGDVAKSLLITAVSYKDKDLQMPPNKDDNKKLSDQEITALTEWVKMGAPDPRTVAAKAGKMTGLSDAARKHWAYQPVKMPAFPTVKNRAWCVTPVDLFILQKIEEKGMAPSAETSKETLLRRATYDLTGLPPTPKEIQEFMSDGSPTAFAKVVDRLLASPHYGERWARYWLDSARYADTTGDRGNNQSKDYRFPYAWTYRDYVIRSFNEDKPYDRFVLEQLAADLLPDRKDPRDLAALGFITVGDRTGSANDIINDRIDTVTKGFLGLTVACARCHDHKFDPIPTQDYYALHGIFNSITEPQDKPIIVQASNKNLVAEFNQKLAALEQENRDFYYSTAQTKNALFREKASSYFLAAWYGSNGSSAADQVKGIEIKQILDEQTALHSLKQLERDNSLFAPMRRFHDGNWSSLDLKKLNPIVAAAFAGKTPTGLDEVIDTYATIFKEIGTKAQDYTKAMASASEPGAKIAGFSPAEIELLNFPFAINPANQLTTVALRKEIEGWPQQLRNSAKWTFPKINQLLLTHDGGDVRAMVVADLPKGRDSSVFIRGQADVKGDVVPRHFLEILSAGKPAAFKLGSGRLELAQAIANKANPLTARTIVNRVWMHHFGEGFVRTPDDLGTQSEPPSHPELLDYLSTYFVQEGWSLKKLHRLIMLSKVYQESSYTVPAHEVIDPQNRLLWRANVRRLDFESMRDSLLVMSGKLDRTVGGQPVNLTEEPYSFRRSIYGYIDRGNLPELMSHFDFSNPEAPNSKRSTTIVPQQALFLMNSPMAVDVARSIVARPEVAQSSAPQHKVYYTYLTVFQRAPKPEETQMAIDFFQKERKEEPNIAAAAKEMSDKAAKKAAERAKREAGDRDNGTKAIRNEGQLVERKPLSPWETYTHALLLSNEAAYVN